MIRFGVGPSGAGAGRQALRERAAQVIGKALGDTVEIRAFEKYSELDSAELDLAWLPPILCLRAIERDHAVILRVVREEGTLYHGAIFVPSSVPRYRPEDLRDLRIAWVDESSCGGYLFPRAALYERDLDPDDLFREEKMLDSHVAVVRAVKSGEVDCGATYLNSRLDGSTRAGWTSEAVVMRCILVSRPIPSDGICSRLESSAEAKSGLLKLNESVAGVTILRELFDAARFEPQDVHHYDPVRSALDLMQNR